MAFPTLPHSWGQAGAASAWKLSVPLRNHAHLSAPVTPPMCRDSKMLKQRWLNQQQLCQQMPSCRGFILPQTEQMPLVEFFVEPQETPVLVIAGQGQDKGVENGVLEMGWYRNKQSLVLSVFWTQPLLLAALDVVNMFTTMTSSEQSRALKKKKKRREGRKEKVMLKFTKTNDPIWVLSLEHVGAKNAVNMYLTPCWRWFENCPCSLFFFGLALQVS